MAKFKIGDKIRVIMIKSEFPNHPLRDGYGNVYTPRLIDRREIHFEEDGEVIGFNEKGYFKSFKNGLKRYKVKLESTGEIIFCGDSKLSKRKEL